MFYYDIMIKNFETLEIMIKEKTENVHSGHRRRMRELVDRVGLENLNEVQALEFTLSYVFPRKDTNEIAHRLIKKFGSFSKVLEAPEKELATVEEVGKDTAKMISQFLHIFKYYRKSKNENVKTIKCIKDLAIYFYNLLIDKSKEECYALAINAKDEIVAIKKIGSGEKNLVTIEKRDLADFAFTNNATKIAIAHNHPSSTCAPSRSDDEYTVILKNWLNAIGVELVDHIIIGTDGAFSFRVIKVMEYPLE